MKVIQLHPHKHKKVDLQSESQKEAVEILKKVLAKIEGGYKVEELVIAYNNQDEFNYHMNSGNKVKFTGILELTKNQIANGF